jgi:DNA-binding NarL/FixJ family response regulator
MIKIILIDDHRIVRNGIRMVLETAIDIEIIGEFDSFAEYQEKIEYLKPDIILMDISMPGISGIEATKILKESHPDIKALILSMHNTEEFILQSLKAGAKGYLQKNTSKKELLSAIQKIYEGEEYFSEDISKIIVKSMIKSSNSNTQSKLDALSSREMELLKLVAEGKSNKDIADALFISIRTVESHKNHIMSKLELKNTVELIKFAIKENIINL